MQRKEGGVGGRTRPFAVAMHGSGLSTARACLMNASVGLRGLMRFHHLENEHLIELG